VARGFPSVGGGKLDEELDNGKGMLHSVIKVGISISLILITLEVPPAGVGSELGKFCDNSAKTSWLLSQIFRNFVALSSLERELRQVTKLPNASSTSSHEIFDLGRLS